MMPFRMARMFCSCLNVVIVVWVVIAISVGICQSRCGMIASLNLWSVVYVL
jgi:hypothetical protein